jgi:hypothetical protein
MNVRRPSEKQKVRASEGFERCRGVDTSLSGYLLLALMFYSLADPLDDFLGDVVGGGL